MICYLLNLSTILSLNPSLVFISTMDQQSNSVSIGSRGTLVSLMDREIEKLQAVKICSGDADLRASTLVPPSTTTSSSSSSLQVLRSSALWSDLKDFLKSSATGHYAPTILFCKDEVNPENGVQEACHIRTPRAKEAEGGHNSPKKGGDKQGRHQRGVYVTEEERKAARRSSQRRNTKLQRDGYHTDDQKQGTMDICSDDGDHVCMVKPMLAQKQQQERKSSKKLGHKHHASNLAPVDLQCCCSYHPLSKRLGFTRLSYL